MARGLAKRFGLWLCLAVAAVAVAGVMVSDPVGRVGAIWARMTAHDPNRVRIIRIPADHPRMKDPSLPRGPMQDVSSSSRGDDDHAERTR